MARQTRSCFPVAAWRLCSRQALGLKAIHRWTEDSIDEDDPLLIEEVRTRVLPRRGIRAAPEEILITMGAQNATYLVAQLLAGPGTTVGVEDPGYVDARNIFALTGARIQTIPVDGNGMQIDRRVERCDCVYVTPSHQAPTTATLPMERRAALLERAKRRGFSVIEDDYEAEINFVGAPTSALKSMDREQTVVYVGTFSKSLAPGLRIGYLVAAAPADRRGAAAPAPHAAPPTVQQPTHRSAVHFRRATTTPSSTACNGSIAAAGRPWGRRWRATCPIGATTPSFGGTSYWLRGPEGLDTEALARAALVEGVVIEPGAVHFHGPKRPRNTFRLGFSSIRAEKIAPGIEKLAQIIDRMG